MNKIVLVFFITVLSYPIFAESTGCLKTLPNDHYEIKNISKGKKSLSHKAPEGTFYAQVDTSNGEFIVNHYYYNEYQKKFVVGASIPVSKGGNFVMAEWSLRLSKTGCIEIIQPLPPKQDGGTGTKIEN